jgi:hypothetical protein
MILTPEERVLILSVGIWDMDGKNDWCKRLSLLFFAAAHPGVSVSVLSSCQCHCP